MLLSPSDNGIEVRGLVREFKGGIRAVDGIDIDVAPGEIYGFLGPNGAGKSTTVHMLTTLLPPTAGSARVAGLDVATQGPEVRKRIVANLHTVFEKMVKKYYADDLKGQLVALYDSVDRFPAADRPAPGEPKLEQQFIGTLLELVPRRMSMVERPLANP